MIKQYAAQGKITKTTFRRMKLKCMNKTYWVLVNLFALFAGFCMSGGIFVVGVSVTLAFMIGFNSWLYMFNMKEYREDVSVVFGEDGIRQEDDVLYMNWLQLTKIYREGALLMVSAGRKKCYVINLDALDGEEIHYLETRLGRKII